MEKQEGYFKSNDGLNLYYRHYVNPAAKYTFLILHGHGEHTGRYEKFIPFLESHPLSVAVYDMRGYGRSEGRQVYVESYDLFIQDVASFVNFLELTAQGSPRPIILFGHSMGGLVALYWLKTRPEKVKGLILSSPCLGLRLAPAVVRFNEWLNRLWPQFIYPNVVYPPHLTHNTAEVEHYRRDPLIRRKMSARLLSELYHACEKYAPAAGETLDFPFYVLMSGLEKVVDKDKTRQVFEALGAPRKELYCFDNFYHEIFNELEQEKAFTRLDEVLKAIYDFNGI